MQHANTLYQIIPAMVNRLLPQQPSRRAVA